MRRVFVYGSLKRGELHHGELARASFVREIRTRPRYTLLEAGEYPGLVRHGSTAVQGELYEVDDALLAHLDAFEDAPESYERSEVELEDGERALAYFLPDRLAEALPVMNGGRWSGARSP